MNKKWIIRGWHSLGTIKPAGWFLILLIGIALIYQYPSIVFKRPQSVHHWRQSDCASMALMYYQDNMHVFHPQTHNLTSRGGTSGDVATSELPLLYYVVAILYRFFGYHDYIYRLFNTLIFLTGLFFLYRSMRLLVQDRFWPVVVPLLFFTSPVLVYYGNNFLTDSSALALAMIGWYYFLKFYQSKKERLFWVSMIIFLLAGACKISALISVVAILVIYLFDITGMMRYRTEGRLFSKPFRMAAAFAFIISVVGGWVWYAKYYNNLHGSCYFSTGILPIWELSDKAIAQIIESVRILWLNDYFHVSTLYFLALIFIVNIWFIKKQNTLFISLLLLLFVGSIFYILLWFQTFNNHDYYTINLYIFLIFNLFVFFHLLNENFKSILASSYIKIAFSLFLGFNVWHTNWQMLTRYQGWWSEHSLYKDYDTVTPYLRSVGVLASDTVISYPDLSHFTLYLMNQRGWTTCMGENSDSLGVVHCIQKGAKYLIVNKNDFKDSSYIHYFMHNQIGNYGSIRIYQLDSARNVHDK